MQNGMSAILEKNRKGISMALAVLLSAGMPLDAHADGVQKKSMVAPPGSSAHAAIADFSGVWRIVGFSEVMRPENSNPEYTEEALRRIRNFEQHYDEAEDSPAKFCYHEGMPWSMVHRARDYPTEIYQSADRVMLFHEGMDIYRHIRLDTKTFPENYVPSAQGYSIAHWDGGDLIIETRGLTATNEVGAHHRSEEARVIERWHLIKQPNMPDRWEITFTLEDPVIFKKPARGRQLMERAEAGTVVGGYNCPQALWDDYIASIKEQREGEPAEDKPAGE